LGFEHRKILLNFTQLSTSGIVQILSCQINYILNIDNYSQKGLLNGDPSFLTPMTPRYNARHLIEEDSMIAIGENAPDFNLKDQFGRDITLGQFNGRRHLILLFYPLDFTPT
jgi:hypothetical protein